jgi:hypothetical protein
VGKVETTRLAVRAMRWWRRALIGAVMLSLVSSLATRTFDVKSSPSTSTNSASAHFITVQSSSPQAMTPNMDRDAVFWVVPVAKITVERAPTFYPRVAPAGPPVAALLLEESLYDRPPPSC